MTRIAQIASMLMIAVFFASCSSDENKSVKQLHTEAIDLYHKKHFNAAIKKAENALQKAKKDYGPDNIIVSDSLEILALFYNSSGEFSKAESLYKKSLAIKGPIHAVSKNLHSPETFSTSDITTKEESDKVLQEIKDKIVKNFAKQNIELSELKPLQPIHMSDGGIVFPYQCVKKEKNMPAENIILLFASVMNSDKSGNFTFRKYRIVTYQSYMDDLNKGGIGLLQKELAKIFSDLYHEIKSDS